MNSFYIICKKKSRQMTELVLIGLVMIIFVIVSSWGTKIINYFKGSIPLNQTVSELSNYQHKNSFDFQDPQNQYIKIKTDKNNLAFMKNQKGFFYYTLLDQNNESLFVVVNNKVHKQIQNTQSKHMTMDIIGGFDVFQEKEKGLLKNTTEVLNQLIFRSGNIGDSQQIEIIISIYLTISIAIVAIIMIILEISGFYIRKTKTQIQHIRDINKSCINQDYKERLKKNKIGFGDHFLYISKNWHNEIYEFHEIVLLHYHIHRYGHFNRYTLVAWNTDKKSFTIAKTLTKEKLMAFIQLIYERNSEIVVEKTVEGKNIQLYYFDCLVNEMRDRQKISEQLNINKVSNLSIRLRNNHRLPIALRHKNKIHYQKQITRRITHTKRGPF